MKSKLIITPVLIFIITICSCLVCATHSEGLITISVKDGDLRDVLKMMGEQSGMNVVPDSSVKGQVSLTLTDVTVEQALQTLLRVYKYNYEKVNANTYIISQQPLSEAYLLEIADNKMTLIAQMIDIKRVLTDIGTKGQINLIYDQSLNSQINANLIAVDFEHGLKTLCSANRLLITEKEGIYSITSGATPQQGRQMAVSYAKGLVSIDARNADLAELIRAIADQAEIDIVLYGGSHQLVDLKINDIPVDDALEMIISGTRYAFTKNEGVYLIGDKSINSPSSGLLTTNEVIHLKYLLADKVPSMLPNTFPATNIKVIKELNALAVVGTIDEINELKAYLDKIDNKIPQIVVEAIIIEVTRMNGKNPLFKFGMKVNDGDEESVLLDTVLGKLTYNSVLKLKPEFYIHLENLVSEGVVTIKSNPKITTLNGFQAEINVANIQYYQTKVSDDDDNSEIEYKSIEAGIKLDVTPWVSSTNEITLELHPNVSNLSGASSDTAPQVSERKIDTTVRVKSGETIILGGLIQDVRKETIDKVPILGSLPWIGQLFQKKVFDLNQNELIMFITPHILNEELETITKEEMEEEISNLKSKYTLDEDKSRVTN